MIAAGQRGLLLVLAGALSGLAAYGTGGSRFLESCRALAPSMKSR
jgi:hypothetical protein